MPALQENINNLRHFSRKLIRELGILEIDKDNEKSTPQHWHALIEISQEPEISISKLAQKLVLHISTASRIVNSLIADKFVKYTTNSDKREKRLQITQKGQNEIKNIDTFSNKKILNAFKFLNKKDQEQIIEAIKKYSFALEKSRIKDELKKIKILTLSNSKALRNQIRSMIEDIQKNEFSIAIPKDANLCVIKAEEDFYFNNSCNFWYATDENGLVIGSIALKKIDNNNGEIKKFFVAKKYRGQKVAQLLMAKLLKAAQNHQFKNLYLGTVDVLKLAQSFYIKSGFTLISKDCLPKNFELCKVDNVFFKGKISNILPKINL